MRGGKRAGAGRPSALSLQQALSVGAEYERLRLKASEDQAFARYRKSRDAMMIRVEQSRAELIPPRLRRRANLSDITESIDEITGGTRAVSLSLKRPYDVRPELVEATIAWCQAEYGKVIPASKAIECWKEYRRFQKWAKTKGSLIST